MLKTRFSMVIAGLDCTVDSGIASVERTRVR